MLITLMITCCKLGLSLAGSACDQHHQESAQFCCHVTTVQSSLCSCLTGKQNKIFEYQNCGNANCVVPENMHTPIPQQKGLEIPGVGEGGGGGGLKG